MPKVAYFPPVMAESEEGRYILIDPSQYMQMGGKSSAEDMARFVKDKAGVSIHINRYGMIYSHFYHTFLGGGRLSVLSF